MLNDDLFKNFQQNYEWLNAYTRSIENLSKIKEVKPGVSSFETVAQWDKVKLLRCQSNKRKAGTKPLIISYALVNRFTIADLQDGKSLLQALTNAGLDVFVIDWGYPDPADIYLDLDDYINGYIDNAVEKTMQITGADNVNILGICQGGALSICYTAIYSHKVARLITMVTPVDFQTPNDILSHMIRKVDLDIYTKAFGNLSGQILNNNFNMLQPINLNIRKWLDSVNSLADEKFVHFFLNMESWINDSPDQAAKAYVEFMQNFYQQNRFVNGGLSIGDHDVDLKNITQPILNVFGSQDHIVPPESSRALSKLTNSKDYSELEIKTGHIGMYVSGKAKEVPEKIISWLK